MAVNGGVTLTVMKETSSTSNTYDPEDAFYDANPVDPFDPQPDYSDAEPTSSQEKQSGWKFTVDDNTTFAWVKENGKYSLSSIENQLSVGLSRYWQKQFTWPALGADFQYQLSVGGQFVWDYLKQYGVSDSSHNLDGTTSIIQLQTKDGVTPVPSSTSPSDIEVVVDPSRAFLLSPLTNDGGTEVTNSLSVIVPILEADVRGQIFQGLFSGEGQVQGFGSATFEFDPDGQDTLVLGAGLKGDFQFKALYLVPAGFSFDVEVQTKPIDLNTEAVALDLTPKSSSTPEVIYTYAPPPGTDGDYSTDTLFPVPTGPTFNSAGNFLITQDLVGDGAPSLITFRGNPSDVLLAWSKDLPITQQQANENSPPNSFVQLNLATASNSESGLTWVAQEQQLDLAGLPIGNQGQLQDLTTASNLNLSPVVGEFTGLNGDLNPMVIWLHQTAENITNPDSVTDAAIQDIIANTDIHYSYLEGDNWTTVRWLAFTGPIRAQ
jgi:hypothetical protein